MLKALWERYGWNSGRFTHTVFSLSLWVLVLVIGIGGTYLVQSIIQIKLPDRDWRPVPTRTYAQQVEAQRASDAFYEKTIAPIKSLAPGESAAIAVDEYEMNAWVALNFTEAVKKSPSIPNMASKMEETNVAIEDEQIKVMSKIRLRGQSQPFSIQMKPYYRNRQPDVDGIDYEGGPRPFFFQKASGESGLELRITGFYIGRLEMSLTTAIELLTEYTTYMTAAQKDMLNEARQMSEAEIRAALIKRFGSMDAATKAFEDFLNAELQKSVLTIPLEMFDGVGKVNIEDINITDGAMQLNVSKPDAEPEPEETADPQAQHQHKNETTVVVS